MHEVDLTLSFHEVWAVVDCRILFLLIECVVGFMVRVAFHYSPTPWFEPSLNKI